MKIGTDVRSARQSAGIVSTLRDLLRAARRSEFARNVSETFATRLILFGTMLVTAVVVARALGPEGRGLYTVAAAIGALGVQFGNLGLQASNTYYAAKDRRLLPALIANTLLISFLLGGAGVAAAWVVFRLWPRLAPLHGAILILSLAWIPFGLAYLLMTNLLIGIQEVRAYNKIEAANKSLTLALIGLAVLAGRSTVEKLFSAGLIALFLSLVWVLLRLRDFLTEPLAPSLQVFRGNIRIGLRAYLASFFAFLVLRIDLLMIQYMLGAKQAGYYSVAVNMADFLLMLPAVVGFILFPKLTAMAETKEKLALTKKAVLGSGAVLVPLLILAAASTRFLVHLMFGEAFAPSAVAVEWLMPGIFFLGLEMVAAQFLASVGFPNVLTVAWFGFSLLNIGLNLWAIPAYGIVGASVVSSLTYFVACVVILLVIQKGRYTPH